MNTPLALETSYNTTSRSNTTDRIELALLLPLWLSSFYRGLPKISSRLEFYVRDGEVVGGSSWVETVSLAARLFVSQHSDLSIKTYVRVWMSTFLIHFPTANIAQSLAPCLSFAGTERATIIRIDHYRCLDPWPGSRDWLVYHLAIKRSMLTMYSKVSQEYYLSERRVHNYSLSEANPSSNPISSRTNCCMHPLPVSECHLLWTRPPITLSRVFVLATTRT